ncbi:hypothetical protein BJ741DRAFT_599528 [Chytriomyces cf. hyalinus JEL632]|nr:hypothetical protein BJ741DRAFT_599528 [Chytriomyces cf. hyalinus JEL632]
MPPKRRAPNAFILYRSERLPVYALNCSRQGIAMSSAALSADIARMWNQESDDVQSEYRVKSRMQQQQLDELGHGIADSTGGAPGPLVTLTNAGMQLTYRSSGSPELPKKAVTVWVPGQQPPRTSIHGIRYVLSQPRDCDHGGTLQARLSLHGDHAHTHTQTPACHQTHPAQLPHLPLSPELPFAKPLQTQPSPHTAHVKFANQSNWTSPQIANHFVNFYPDQSDRNSGVGIPERHRPRFMPYDISQHQQRVCYPQPTARSLNMGDNAFDTSHTASVNGPFLRASVPHLLYRQERKGGLSIYDLVEATDIENHDKDELGQALRVAQNEVARLENLIEKSAA